MSDRDIAQAEAVIAAAEAGAYDTQLGISTEERALLTKANSDEPLTVADVRALTAHNRPDLIAAAYNAGRITLTEGDNA